MVVRRAVEYVNADSLKYVVDTLRFFGIKSPRRNSVLLNLLNPEQLYEVLSAMDDDFEDTGISPSRLFRDCRTVKEMAQAHFRAGESA